MTRSNGKSTSAASDTLLDLDMDENYPMQELRLMVQENVIDKEVKPEQPN